MKFDDADDKGTPGNVLRGAVSGLILVLACMAIPTIVLLPILALTEWAGLPLMVALPLYIAGIGTITGGALGLFLGKPPFWP